MIEWIKSLTDKDRESFIAFCKQAASPIQMYLYSRFLGFEGSIVDCDKWAQKKFKKMNFKEVLEREIDAMKKDISN